MPRRLSLLASVSLATFVLSVLAATQLRSQPVPPSNRFARNEALRSSVTDLEGQNRRLKETLREMEGRVRKLEDQSADRSSSARRAKDLLDSEKELVGLMPLHGPGLTIALHDAKDPNNPQDRSLGWVVHYQDLQDLVNLLWASGAEAIAINQERVVPTTSFFYAGVNVLVNNASRVNSPYVITVLGDPPPLEAGLNDPNRLVELKSRSHLYKLGISWQRGTRLSVPAYDATFLLKYAQPLS